MSATVDRLSAMEQETVALPWPLEIFRRLPLPDPARAFLFALTEAWPVLRDEITGLEARLAEAEFRNAGLVREHHGIVANSTALGRQMEAMKAEHQSQVMILREQVRAAEANSAADRAALARLPQRIKAAETVCDSIRTTMPGPRRLVANGAHGWFDGGALDEWKASL